MKRWNSEVKSICTLAILAKFLLKNTDTVINRNKYPLKLSSLTVFVNCKKVLLRERNIVHISSSSVETFTDIKIVKISSKYSRLQNS